MDALACLANDSDDERKKRSSIELYRELADLYGMHAEHGKAVQCYEKILAMDVMQPAVHLSLGECYEKLGEQGRAAQAYADALICLNDAGGADGDRCTVYMRLGILYSERGDYDRALEYLGRAKALDRDGTAVDRALGDVHLRRREYAAAAGIYEHILEREPGAADVCNSLGHAYNGAGDGAKALEYFARAREAHRDDAGTVRHMAEICLKQGEYDRGIEVLTGHLQGSAADADTGVRGELYLLLSRLYSRRGDRAAAAAVLRDCLAQGGSRDVFLANRMLNIAEYLEGRTVLASKPTALTVYVTSRCNLRCSMCGVPGRELFDMSEKTVREVMELLPYLEHITWLGGEVFMSRSFAEMFDASLAYPNIARREIITNGLLLSEPVIEKYVRYGVALTMSIDGMTRTTYERIRRGARYEDLLRNLELIAKYRARYGRTGDNCLLMNFVVMKSNYEEIALIPAFAERYGFDCVNLIRMYPSPGLEDENIENDPAAWERLRALLPGVAKQMEALHVDLRLEHSFVNMDLTGLPRDPERDAAAHADAPAPVPRPQDSAAAGQPSCTDVPAPEEGIAPAMRCETPRPGPEQRDPCPADPRPLPVPQGDGSADCRAPGARHGCNSCDGDGTRQDDPYLFDTYASRCRAPWHSLILKIDSQAYPDCDCEMPVGDYTRQSILELWNGEPMQRYRAALKNRDARGVCGDQCLMKKNVGRTSDSGTF
jgi:tetratricopeptide (TPR) repeat protein